MEQRGLERWRKKRFQTETELIRAKQKKKGRYWKKQIAFLYQGAKMTINAQRRLKTHKKPHRPPVLVKTYRRKEIRRARAARQAIASVGTPAALGQRSNRAERPCHGRAAAVDGIYKSGKTELLSSLNCGFGQRRDDREVLMLLNAWERNAPSLILLTRSLPRTNDRLSSAPLNGRNLRLRGNLGGFSAGGGGVKTVYRPESE